MTAPIIVGRVEAVRAGRITRHDRPTWDEVRSPWRTAFWKDECAGPVRIGTLGLDGFGVSRFQSGGDLRLRGIQTHIGSQLTSVKPFEAAVKKLLPLVTKLKAKYNFEFFSIGGGIGIMYRDALASGVAEWWRKPAARRIITPAMYAGRLVKLLQPLGLRILMEPGRFISGNAGILVTRIEFVKQTGRKNFLIVDAAMNDLIRPAFYDSYHEIVPLRRKVGKLISSDVVGPICESGDYFAKDRLLPKLGEGDCIALMSAGAYGSVMGSNYNSRALIAEVLVSGKKVALVRERQRIADIWAGEKIAAWQR